MKRLQAALLVGALAGAFPAYADEATRAGFSLGVRGAYAWPMGDLVSGAKSSDVFERMIPIWVDATIRLGGGFEIGPYAQYGWVKGKNGVSDAKDWRLGGQLNYRLTPAWGVLPWVGIGAGYEWLKFDNSPTTTNQVFTGATDADISGLELLVQGGFDIRLTPYLAVGPFAAVTFGRFSSGDLFGAPVSPGKSWHEWLHVGARLSIDI